MTATRYSGTVRVRVRVRWDDATDQYRVTVATPEGRASFWVGGPAVRTIAVDCPEAFDDTAHAALSFARVDYPDLDVDSHAFMNDAGWVIERKKGNP